MVNWFACEQEMLLSINLSSNEDAKMPIKCVMVMRIASGKISNRQILIRWSCHPIGISFEIKLRDHLVFGHNDSGGDYLYSYCPKDQADFVITNGAYSYNTYGGAAIDSGATHDCVAYCVDEDF